MFLLMGAVLEKQVFLFFLSMTVFGAGCIWTDDPEACLEFLFSGERKRCMACTGIAKIILLKTIFQPILDQNETRVSQRTSPEIP